MCSRSLFFHCRLFSPCIGGHWHWAIPENIHTIPRTAFRIFEGEGGVHDYGILRA